MCACVRGCVRGGEFESNLLCVFAECDTLKNVPFS